MKIKPYLLCCFIGVASLVNAIPGETIRGVKVKYYDTQYKAELEANLNAVPQQYLKNIVQISAFNERERGYYFIPGVISLQSAQKWVLAHELAHHYQYLTGEGYLIPTHGGNFKNYYTEIMGYLAE